MKPRISQLDQSGASDGDVITWDDTAGEWVPEAPAGGGSYTDPLTTKGDLVGRSATTTVRIPVGTNGQVLQADSTDANGVKWATPGSSGGFLSQSYQGYNTVGASTELFNGFTIYTKQFTLANAALCNSLDLHLKDNGSGQVGSLSVGVMENNAGTPGKIIALGRAGTTDTLYLSTTARWISCALGAYLAAGTYWMFWHQQDSSGSSLLMHYDTSGSDRTIASAGVWAADASLYTITTTTKRYSARVSCVS